MSLPMRSLATVLVLAGILAACSDSDSDSSFALALEIVRPLATDTLHAREELQLAVALRVPEGTDPDTLEIRYDWDFGDGSSSQGDSAVLLHTWSEAGNYTLRVNVNVRTPQGEEIRRGASRGLVILPTPELVATGATLSVSSLVVRDAETFRISGDITSAAAPVSEPWTAGFYVGRADSMDPTSPLDPAGLTALIASERAFELSRVNLAPIGAAPATALVDDATLKMPETAPSGDYLAFVFIDPDGRLPEIDKSNNAAFASRRLSFERTGGEGPDLVVSGVSAQPTLTNRLDAITLSATVTNTGNVVAEPSVLGVFLSQGNPTLDGDDILLGVFEVDPLPAGRNFKLEEVVVPIDPPQTEPGTWFVLVQADLNNDIIERSKANNLGASPRITVTTDPVPGVDIVPLALQVRPASTFVGGTVQIDLDVANMGDEPVLSQFLCRVYFSEDSYLEPSSDPLVHTMLVEPLAVGEERSLQVDAFVPPIATGSYQPFVVCDASNLVSESNEANNLLASTSQVQVAAYASVDLRPGFVSIEPLTVANGDPMFISLEVCNDGSNGSTPSSVMIQISGDGRRDNDDSILFEARVPPIEPGACVTLEATVEARCDTFVSDYIAFVTVDPNNQVTETNELNNTIMFSHLLRFTSLICNCVDDDLEPNDSPFGAPTLDPAISFYPSRTMCSSHLDYYQVELEADETIRVTIDFEHERGDLDLQLFYIDRVTLLDESATRGDREEVSYIRVPRTGSYMIRVMGKTPGDRNVYDMHIERNQPGAGVDLIVLNADIGRERPLLGETVRLCFDTVNLGIRSVPPSLARVYLTSTTAVDPLNDLLLASVPIASFTSRLTSCVNIAIPETIAAGPRYLAVVADAANDIPDEVSKDNNIGFTPRFEVDTSCHDFLEPNNSLEDARTLELVGESPFWMPELLVCSGNRDFYQVCVDDGDFLSFEVRFDPTAGDVDLRLWSEGNIVARSEQVGGVERVEVDYVAGARCYVLEVFVVNPNREVPYGLEVETGPADEGLECSRAEEPNDSMNSAVPLRDFMDTCAAICPQMDEDWYQISLAAGTNFEVRLQGPGGGAPPEDVNLALFGPARNFIASTVTADETLQVTIPLSGTYWLRARANGRGPRSQPYCLQVDGLPGVDLIPLNFAMDSGVAVASQTIRFTFDLLNSGSLPSVATTYRLSLSTDPVLSSGDLLLREVELPALAGMSSRLEGRRFDVPESLVDGGEFFLILQIDPAGVVPELNRSNNTLVLPFTVLPRCVADAAEPNDYPEDAAPALDFVGVDLSSCGRADTDWFHLQGVDGPVVVKLRFFDAEGDLDLYVYQEMGPGLSLVGVSDSVSDDESVSFLADEDTEYLIEVRQHTDLSTTYRLEIHTL